ncbi:MAG: CbiX/SirB N-terminal domain-containing protein [Gammaproteobacteria bacterium]|nr:CbiX/SirB N-terminal domain-containing protein [Gammaproteobacteria bacterium]
MKSLLLVAHGSRRTESNAEIAVVAESLSCRVKHQYAQTAYAFLELAEPSIQDGIDKLVMQGATDITILPYFLSAGRHVHEDVPEIINMKKKQYNDVNLHIAPYIGEADEMIDVLVAISEGKN